MGFPRSFFRLQIMSKSLFMRSDHDNVDTFSLGMKLGPELAHPAQDILQFKHELETPVTPCNQICKRPRYQSIHSELPSTNPLLGGPSVTRPVIIENEIKLHPEDVLLTAFTWATEEPRKRSRKCSFTGIADFEDDDLMDSFDAEDNDLLETPRFKKRPAVSRATFLPPPTSSPPCNLERPQFN
jgi:hypothetical protein